MIVAMPCIVFILSIFALQTLSTHTTQTQSYTHLSQVCTLLHHQRAGTRPGSAPADHLSATIGVVQCADSPDPVRGFLI